MSKNYCGKCIFFKPHIYFPYLGYCVVKDNMTMDSVLTVCESYKPVSIDELKKALSEQGWLYCVNCRRTIYTETELEEHVKEHLVAPGIIIDEAVREEAHSGD